jgi:hypothetical protein
MAFDSISKFARRDEWQERFNDVVGIHLDLVLEAFDLDREDLPDRLGDALIPLFDFILEDFLTWEFEPGGGNIVEAYLKRRGWRESGPGKLYLQALRHSVVGVYEVTGVAPGSHFMAKDLVRGGPSVAVYDKLGSRSVVRWDRIAGRLVTLGGQLGMSGGALPLDFEDAGVIVKQLAEMRAEAPKELADSGGARDAGLLALPESPLDDGILRNAAPLISGVWLAGSLRRQSGAGRPNLVNTDGEEFVFATTRFPLAEAGRAGEIERRLDRLRKVYREDGPEPAWTWFSKARPPAKRELSDAGLTLIAKDGLNQTVLGAIRLEPGGLILETNSVGRAERGAAMLAAALEGLVGTPLTATTSVDQALKEAAGRNPADPEPEPVSPEDEEALLDAFMTQQYRDVLSTPLPVLDGKTPRQAARTKAGRQRVAEWVKYLENRTARQSDTPAERQYDFGWMWEELKISDLRQ